METFLAPSWHLSTQTTGNSHLQRKNEGYISMPFSFLVEEQGLDAPFMPTSPSLDMEAALEHLYTGSSCNSELRSTDFLVDELMVDPFLDYLNEMLMEEGEEDVPCMQQDAEASYRAIVSSLYDIIGEHPSLDSSSSEGVSAIDPSGRYVSPHDATIYENVSGFHLSHPWDESSHHEQHADITKPYIELGSLSNEVHNLGVSTHALPASVNSEQQGKAETTSIGGINDFRSDNGAKVQDQEQGTNNFDLLLSDDKSALKSFEELKEIAGYAALYVGKPSLLDTSTIIHRGSSPNGVKKKSSRAARKGSQSIRNSTAEVVGSVDLREVLVSCAHAVAMGNVKKVSEVLQELYQVHGVSVKGSSLQRTAYYFCDALVARMGGVEGHQFRIMCENRPAMVQVLKASRFWYGVNPYLKIMHYFANQSILKAAEGASRLHILDYGTSYGTQWPCLINALADCEGGPPLLVITGIESPKPGQNSIEILEESGRRLAAFAWSYGVPFKFHAIVSDKWEDIDPTSFDFQENEVLVVNCIKHLCNLADESVDYASGICPRQKLLMSMRSLNPHLLIMAEMNLALNSPFFVSRFREAVYFYFNMLDMLDTVAGDNPERILLEKMCYSHAILNIVACEGAERVERPETYKQWELRIRRAGFELLPVLPVILSRSRSYVKQHHHKDFLVHEDANGWLLMGWKGRPLLAMSAWKPSVMK